MAPVTFCAADVLLFSWRGKPDGSARYVEHVNRYARNGVEYAPALF